MTNETFRNPVPENAFVVLVDIQWDFVDRDGKLYIPDADKTITPLQQFYDSLLNAVCLFTLDTHLAEVYNQSPEAKMFPPHCIKGTPGHDLVITPRYGKEDWFLEKGLFDMWAESNLTIYNKATPMSSHLFRDTFFETHVRNFDTVYVVGHALNYCVKYAVDGLIRLGYKVKLIKELTCGIKQPNGSGLDPYEVFANDIARGKLEVISLND